MMAATHIVRQRDFSGCELIDATKRRDDVDQQRASGRQVRNWRVQSAGNLVNRPGRQALFPQVGRTQTVIMPGDVRFRVSFGEGTISIRDAAGSVVATQSGYPWTVATRQQIAWTVVNRDILICYPGSVPKIARRNAATGAWTFFDFSFSTGYQGEIRAPFYRFPETLGITITPSAREGAISIASSAPVFAAGQVGTNLRYKGCQIHITGFSDAQHVTGTVLQPLPPAQVLTVPSADGFYVGQVVTGSTTGATGEITGSSAGGRRDISVSTTSGNFVDGEVMSGSTSGASGEVYSLGATNPKIISISVPSGSSMLVRETVVGGTSSATAVVTSFVPGATGMPGTASARVVSGAFSLGGGGVSGDAETVIAEVSLTEGTLIAILDGTQAGATARETWGTFSIGETVTGGVSGATGTVAAATISTVGVVTIQLKSIYTGFTVGETLVSPTSRTTISTISTAALQPSIEWDEQAASTFRGWPRGCLYDRSRVAMFDLPQIPEGIIWSAIDAYADFYVGADADNAMFELVPGRKHVIHMLGGPDQFVFTDAGVFYIPISESNPLKPGSIAFVSITSDGCGAVQPVATPDGLLFLNDGLSRVIAISQSGAVTRPYVPQDVTELCSHLIKSPVCMAATTGAYDFPERYVYVVNADGTLAVGRFASNKKWVGWSPWDGVGAARWCSSLGAEMLFNVDYAGASTVSLVERQDATQVMDGAVTLNAVASTLAPSGGAGPLWMWSGLSVDLVDQGRDLGERAVDATGHLVTLLGDDFSSATIVAGQGWTSTFEPFIPHVAEGRDLGQTQTRRRLVTAAVAVEHSVGFEWGGRAIPAYAWGEEGGAAPVPREDTYRFKGIGRSFDPRAVLTKSRPGSISIVEVSLEVTV